MLDITTTPIEIAPTTHYSMGGVWVRSEDHGTGIEASTPSARPPAGCTRPTGSAATR
jgi:succinate dehydrogenase/fumarate reductase flavoprotein subunit